MDEGHLASLRIFKAQANSVGRRFRKGFWVRKGRDRDLGFALLFGLAS